MSTVLGVPLPNSWSAAPVKHVTSMLNRGSAPDYVDVGPVRAISQASNQASGLDWSRTRFHDFSGNAKNLKGHLRPNDVLINSTGTGTLGRIGYFTGSPDGLPCMADSHVTIARAKPDELDARFSYYWLSSRPFQEYVYAALVVGATNQIELNRDRLGDAPVPLPPLEEQRRIAEFLDAETARIDSLAGLGERQINLLRERAEATVAQFFGPGAGRREYRFRHLMESNPCYGVLVPKFSDVGVPLIRVSDLGRLDHDLERLPRIEEEQAQEYKRTRISPGDLLITVVGATIGRCDVAPPETAGFNVSRALARVQLAAGISPQMIASWVRGRDFRIQAELVTSGAAAQPALNMSDITHFTVWLPETPSGRLDLARRVSTHEDETRRLLSAIERKQALISERRQALITAAVTGQFDVSTASGRNVTDGVSA
ncbi:restriction endonuclease subunit S [Streptomyces sp. NBC_01235]|uniref:restriction endonuclease subunit S n=1 Tax=Streptomyces sp. NBC_01235 TaxID=2903788 RepID=UPI002E0D79E4|nr:restriction endonuclease subunit S [Streptomyces sp. NBC_01235]